MRLQLAATFPAAVLFSVCAATLSAAQAPSAPTDACALLTSGQIQTVLGVTMTPGQPLTPTIRSSCKWLESGVDPFKAKTVIVSIKSVQAYEVGKSLTGGNFKMTPLSGIGDDAYMISGTLSYGATVSVRKSGIAYVVTVRGYPDVPTLEQKEQALAKLVSF